MIAHTGLAVRDFKAASTFYERALAPLGYSPKMQHEESTGFNDGKNTDFWIGKSKNVEPTHVARECRRVAADVYDGPRPSVLGSRPEDLRHLFVHAGARWVEDHNIRWKRLRQGVLDARCHDLRPLGQTRAGDASGVAIELDRGHGRSARR